MASSQSLQYFGGTVDTKAFSDPRDLEYLKKLI